ncbi:unnamed protein product, partial [Mesorhabditis belari]|uniref:Signal transducing adapter molecule 1 n=1 Tax=Mesorhabditis belari TaxID=2138241 RepID=A0AAF3F3G1_9BILA
MAASSIEALIEKLTAESVFEINWDGFVELSDRLKKAPGVHKDAINTLKKRLNSRDPHIVQNAIELLDFLWKNVTAEFRQEISSKKTIAELQAKATSAEAQTARKMREKIKQWAEEECKKDPSLSLIESLYRELAKSGYDFGSKDPSAAVAEKKRKEALLKEEEERQLMEAIQQSLKVSSTSAATTKRSTASTPAPAAPQTAKLEKQVRAVYDFPAAEDNEMSFNTGDVITVLDDSNPHWWKARLNGREGLIPAQFVEDITAATVKKENNPVAVEPVKVEIRAQIDEDVLLRTIDVLQQCDPSGLRPDPEGLDELEAASLAQAPLINEQLSQIDRLTNMLTKVDMSIRNALAEYDNAVQNSAIYQVPTSTMAYPQQHPMPPNMPMQQQQMHQVQQHQQHQMPQQQQWNSAGQVPQGMMQQPQQSVSLMGGPITSQQQQPPQPLHHPQQVPPSLHYTMAQQPPAQPIQSLTSQPYSTGY